MSGIIHMLLALPVLLVLAVLQSPITIAESRVTNRYPEGIAFEVDASSSAGEVTTVELIVRLMGDSTSLNLPAEFTAGRQVGARVEWDARYQGVPPGSIAEFNWKVRDSAGNELVSEPQTIGIEDSRFAWKTLEGDDLVLWWYAGDAAFGQEVFDTAERSLAEMRRASRADLTQPLHIVLYDNRQDFASWHNYVVDWVGGEAYPWLGLTVQIVPPDSMRGWIDGVIPHEVAHLFFYQATYSPLGVTPPSWLNEGYAVFHEFFPQEGQLAEVRQAAASGDLIPLRLATGSFGVEENRVGLLYSESLSAVTFLYRTWGEEGVAHLLEAFRMGADLDDALLQVSGLEFEGFQEAWWEWLGGAPDGYPTPPPWPPPTQRVSAAPSATPEPTKPATPEGLADGNAAPFSCLPIVAIVLAAGGWGAPRKGRRLAGRRP